MILRRCRWYDISPGWAFLMRLLFVLPSEQQGILSWELNQYIQRQLLLSSMTTLPLSNRWYDRVPLLTENLTYLQNAPESVQRQAALFLKGRYKAIQAPSFKRTYWFYKAKALHTKT